MMVLKYNIRLFYFRIVAVLFLCFFYTTDFCSQSNVPQKEMKMIYDEIKTSYKYGLVLIPEDNSKMVDSPSVFRVDNLWYMTYIVFDGKGYETWLAISSDLLHWEKKGRIMSFTEDTWDSNQKAGYIALQNYEWAGSYCIQKYKGNYWMSYLGGEMAGYEAGRLGVGIAYTSNVISEVHEWNRLKYPVLSSTETDSRWYDNQTIYKSSIIWDKKETLGYPFVMFYNAKGSSDVNAEAERIAMAVSKDMLNWERYGNNPIIDHGTGISGDAFLAKINKIWVLFYFGAFWEQGAFNRFACSYDLINWTKWEGLDLISPSEEYDNKYAHKPFVIKNKKIVYHFYCAVDKHNNRGIAVATSVDLGKSKLSFAK